MNALPAVLAASAAAAAARAERRHVDALRVTGATAPERAVQLEQLGLVRDEAFKRLTARGVVREAARGGVYLDEAAVIAHRDRPPASPRVLLAVVGGLLAALGAVLAGMLMRGP